MVIAMRCHELPLPCLFVDTASVDAKLLILQAGNSISRGDQPSFIYIYLQAVVIKEGSSMLKAILAAAGFLLMMDSRLATNPYALAVLVCTAAAILAPVTLTDYKYAAFLTMITFNSLVLCQYRSIPFANQDASC